MGAHRKTDSRGIRRSSGQSMDPDFYRDRAAQARSIFLRELLRHFFRARATRR